jgi:hypothetical protein
MNRRTAIMGTALLGAFIAGCAVGGSVTFHRLVTPMAGTLGLVESARAGNEAYVLYRYGAYSVAKTALLDYAGQLRAGGPVQDLLGGAVATADLQLTYGRLAVAAARAGHQEEAARYFDLAIQTSTNRIEKLTWDDIRTLVERLDVSWDERLRGLDPSSRGVGLALNQTVQQTEPSRSASETNRISGPASLRR